MSTEHGNSLHFISSAVHFLYKNFPKKVHFLYNNFPKKSIFSTQTSSQKAIFWEKIKKIAPQNPGSAPPGLGRRADPPTGADRAIPKPAQKGSILTEQKIIGLQIFSRSLPARLLADGLIRLKTTPSMGQKSVPRGAKAAQSAQSAQHYCNGCQQDEWGQTAVIKAARYNQISCVHRFF